MEKRDTIPIIRICDKNRVVIHSFLLNSDEDITIELTDFIMEQKPKYLICRR